MVPQPQLLPGPGSAIQSLTPRWCTVPRPQVLPGPDGDAQSLTPDPAGDARSLTSRSKQTGLNVKVDKLDKKKKYVDGGVTPIHVAHAYQEKKLCLKEEWKKSWKLDRTVKLVMHLELCLMYWLSIYVKQTQMWKTEYGWVYKLISMCEYP